MRTQVAGTLCVLMFALIVAVDAWAFGLLDLSASLRERGVTLTRPAVIFDHNGHNDAAQIMDCRTCHHGYAYENGTPVEAGDSVGLACAECHGASADANADPVARAARRAADTADAMHLRCGGCHADVGRGPVACVGCHAD